MAYKQLFLDSDILLDMLLEREPFYGFSQLLIIESNDKGYSLNTSALIIANIHYILAKKTNKLYAREGIRKLIGRVNVLSFEMDDISMALESRFDDLEDAIQYYIAKKNKCDAILSRNIKHYKLAELPVLTAEQFLRSFLF
ncbi:MAG: PIN domain-containing protein [Mucilaginibacter sp.]